MKDLLIGIGIGFVVGAVMTKVNKPTADIVDKGVKKGKEIICDIADEVEAMQDKAKKQEPAKK